MDKLKQRSLLNALGTAAYVAIIATLLQNGERIFGEPNSMVAPIAFLLLFVMSASITGGLVLGKPILMYMDGQKKEAVQMFLYTLGWLALVTVILFAAALGFRN
ncbi:MAG TPA: hypothetical protein VHQ41_03915 [Patescibacteria group bacterium]|jgi:hypothetical protein|nr:hypothetical protein [Patescibacteria group bacterium]